VVFPEQGSPTIKWSVATLTPPGVGRLFLLVLGRDALDLCDEHTIDVDPPDVELGL